VSAYYITTPIYYVNDVPHLGTAFCTLVADALARYHRARGQDVRFLTGTDEHGQKIQQTAEKAGKTPIEHADSVVERFRAAWEHLDITNDDFIRTTEDRHKKVVADLWKRIEAAGDIYLGAYKGWYCVRCEAFYTESQLEKVNDHFECPTHEDKVDWVEEPSFFFAMSKYQDRLLKHFEDNPKFVQPEHFRKEIMSFIRGGLRDLSISRTTFDWGIRAPGHPEHVIYVWLDALTNYMSALGGPDGELYERYWPASCHLIGKDILRFHSVYWPCFLMSAGLPLPESIVTTGFWNVRGKKISKSIPATRVDPNALADDIGIDALRYFLMREVPLGLDGDFTYESLVGRYNADLANDLGNLLHRAITMTGKFCGGQVPPVHDTADDLGTLAAEVSVKAAAHFDGYAPSRALEEIWRLVRATNQYVDASQPWKLAKDPDNKDKLEHTMHTALEAIYWIALMAGPVLPHKSAEILRRLGFGAADLQAQLSRWPDPGEFNKTLPAGFEVFRGEPLFPRIDDDRATELYDKWMPGDPAAAPTTPKASIPAAPAAPAAPAKNSELIGFDEFQRLDLRVALIKVAEHIPKADRLLRLELDIGGQTRQVVAGIASKYAPEELLGRKVIFLANLKPAKIRGVKSEGMVLAAGDKDILGLSAVDSDVPPGTIIR